MRLAKDFDKAWDGRSIVEGARRSGMSYELSVQESILKEEHKILSETS